MTQFIISGGKPLKGIVEISGAKNAAIKMVACSILATQPITLRNVPKISDIDVMVSLVGDFGVKANWIDEHTLVLDPSGIHSADPNPELVKKLRASVLLIGPALARFGKIRLPTPGGDQIGKRPINTHLNALKQLGAKIEKQGEIYNISAEKLRGSEVYLDEMSVTATENTLLAATLARGTTTIHVAACEPEIVNLTELLSNMGAQIKNAGSPTIIVKGTNSPSGGLGGGQIDIIPDRIEASTLLLAGIITKGEVTVKNISPALAANLLPAFERMGVTIEKAHNSITAKLSNDLNPINIDTRPYPGFSTDLQSPLAAVATQAKGKSHIFETLFEDRFNYVEELNSMGAKIIIEDPHNITIEGPTNLKAREMVTKDIRAGAALVLAALCAQGESKITNAELIDRGYEKLDEKLRQLGAQIKRVEK